MMRYDVSVIVATYNPEFGKLCKTLISVMLQEKVNLEIIVTDDGSKENYFPEIEALLLNHQFFNYKLLPSEHNIGICSNLYRASIISTGMYTKFISPGDYLFDALTLYNWRNFLVEKKALVCFANVVYYSDEGNNLVIHKRKNLPRNLMVYRKYGSNAKRINYLVLNDGIVGASFLSRSDITRKYLQLINGKVKYAEDTMYRIMLYDGVDIVFFDSNALWYEYGTGISTKKSDFWSDQIKKDYDEANKIMLSAATAKDRFFLRYRILSLFSGCGRYIRFVSASLLFPSVLYWKYLWARHPTVSPTDVNIGFYEIIGKCSLSSEERLSKDESN